MAQMHVECFADKSVRRYPQCWGVEGAEGGPAALLHSQRGAESLQSSRLSEFYGVAVGHADSVCKQHKLAPSAVVFLVRSSDAPVPSHRKADAQAEVAPPVLSPERATGEPSRCLFPGN